MPGCEIHERSARGYCPDDTDGHAAEREGVLDLEPQTATVETATVQAPPPADQLPATGADPLGFGALALTLIAVGALAARRART